jgi:hypothetical protein
MDLAFARCKSSQMPFEARFYRQRGLRVACMVDCVADRVRSRSDSMGLVRKSKAPDSIARTPIAMSPRPVRKTTGQLLDVAAIRS